MEIQQLHPIPNLKRTAYQKQKITQIQIETKLSQRMLVMKVVTVVIMQLVEQVKIHPVILPEDLHWSVKINLLIKMFEKEYWHSMMKGHTLKKFKMLQAHLLVLQDL